MNASDYGPIGLLVIQSTSLCNLDCSYCYLPDRQKRNIFNLQNGMGAGAQWMGTRGAQRGSGGAPWWIAPTPPV